MEINFIPLKLRPKRASRIPYLIVALAYIFALLFLGTKCVTVARQKGRIENKKQLIASLRGNLSMHANALDELKAVISQGMKLVKRGDHLRRIKQSHISWTGILLEIDRIAPAKLYFEELDFDSSAPEVRLIGFYRGGLADTDMLEFVSALQESAHLKEIFSEIKLASSALAEGKKDTKRGEIVMSFKKAE